MKDENLEPENLSPREQLEARVLAMLLGEADAAERVELEVRLDGDPELQAYREQMEKTLGLVEESAQSLWSAGEPVAPKLSEERRATIHKTWTAESTVSAPETTSRSLMQKIHPLIPIGMAAGLAILLGGVWLPRQLEKAEANKVAFQADLPASKPDDHGRWIETAVATDKVYENEEESQPSDITKPAKGRELLQSKESGLIDYDGDDLVDPGKYVGNKDNSIKLGDSGGQFSFHNGKDRADNRPRHEDSPFSSPAPEPEAPAAAPVPIATNTSLLARDGKISEVSSGGRDDFAQAPRKPGSKFQSGNTFTVVTDNSGSTPAGTSSISSGKKVLVLEGEADGNAAEKASKLMTKRSNEGNRLVEANEKTESLREMQKSKPTKVSSNGSPPPKNLKVPSITRPTTPGVPVLRPAPRNPVVSAQPDVIHYRWSGGNENKERELADYAKSDKEESKPGSVSAGWAKEKQKQGQQQTGERTKDLDLGQASQLEEQSNQGRLARQTPKPGRTTPAQPSASSVAPGPSETPQTETVQPSAPLGGGGFVVIEDSLTLSGFLDASYASSSEKKNIAIDPTGLDLDSTNAPLANGTLKPRTESLPNTQLDRLRSSQAAKTKGAGEGSSTVDFGDVSDKLNNKPGDARLERPIDEELAAAPRGDAPVSSTRYYLDADKSSKGLKTSANETLIETEKLALKEVAQGLSVATKISDASAGFTEKSLRDEIRRGTGSTVIAGIPPAPVSVPDEKEGRNDQGIRVPIDLPEPKPEVVTAKNPYSTFSLNISDASFRLSEATLMNGQLPPPHVVRAEEFINAFDYRDSAPAKNMPLAFAWERSRHPFAHNRDLVRFSIRTAAEGREGGQALNLVLAIDNSGSMERSDRVAILREALKVLAAKLRDGDTVSVIAFARTPRLWMDGQKGESARRRLANFDGLVPQGGTNIDGALDLGYATALKHFISGGNNRVILLTDGAANLGAIVPKNLRKKVETFRKRGVALDCFGIGWDGYNDHLMEALARNGDGRYAFLNSAADVERDFARKLAGALSVSAADVKVQVVFNPERVITHRQVGYLRHQLDKQDFRDNTVDAAEIGAAESGNAIYVLQLDGKGSGPIGIVRVRYREPATGKYREMSWPLAYRANVPSLAEATPAMRLAASSSSFAEWLARSPFAAEVDLNAIQAMIAGLEKSFPSDTPVKVFQRMVAQARQLGSR